MFYLKAQGHSDFQYPIVSATNDMCTVAAGAVNLSVAPRSFSKYEMQVVDANGALVDYQSVVEHFKKEVER